MRILVTGGLGLIGRGLTRALRRGRPDVALRIADLRQEHVPGAEVVHGDMCDPAFVRRATRGCDAVVHLAGHLGVESTEGDHLTCLETNVVATRALLDACLANGVGRIVIASSSEVYGETDGQLSETTQVRPKSVYAVAKLAGERYALAYHQRHGLDARIVRFFNVYGPWQRQDFVMSRFVDAVRDGKPPEVYGDGGQMRSFCHVDDASRGVLALLFKDEPEERLFNIGNDREPISMLELARRAIAISGRALEPKLVPFVNSDRSATREIRWRLPAIERAARLLGYQPRISLEEGLRGLLSGPKERSQAASATHVQVPRIWFGEPESVGSGSGARVG